MDEKEIQELEQKLRESAGEMPQRDFAEVWGSIKDKGPQKGAPSRKRSRRKVRAIVASALGIVLVGGIVAPVAIRLSTGGKQYFDWQDLHVNPVAKEKFLSELSNSKVEYVDFSQYDLSLYQLYQTETMLTKGGRVKGFDDSNNPTYAMTVEFFDDTVRLSENLYADYDLTYAVNGAKIHYKEAESDVEGLFEYAIKAEYRSVTYLIEYSSFSEGVQPFLNEFFS